MDSKNISFPAYFAAYHPGEEGGNAIVDIMSGKVNPSVKLASSFPVDYNDIPSAKNFPGTVLEGPDPNSKNRRSAL